MITLLIMLSVLQLITLILWSNSNVRHERERKELIDRIQAGSLREYEQVKQGPGRAIVKDIDQLANEIAHDKGVTVASLKSPTQWRSWR
jgi:preprotein translocase subunit YajC